MTHRSSHGDLVMYDMSARGSVQVPKVYESTIQESTAGTREQLNYRQATLRSRQLSDRKEEICFYYSDLHPYFDILGRLGCV